MENLQTRNESRGPDADQVALFRLAWFIGVALVFALMAPQPLFAATFSALLGIGSLALSLGAMVLREPVWPAHLTRWDLAAILYVLSGFFGWFVDRGEVREFLRAQGYAD
jgi:hypothetical protein